MTVKYDPILGGLREADEGGGVSLTTAQTTAGGINVPALTSGNVLLDASGKPLDLASKTADLLQSGTMRLSAVGNSLFSFPTSFLKSTVGYMDGRASAELSPATGGAQSSALAAQVASVPGSANAVAVMEGTNDAAGSVTVSQHITNLKTAVSAVVARGMAPVVVAAPPRDTTIPLITSYWLAERLWCESANLSFVDPWSRYVGTNGGFVSGSTSDGDHPNPAAMWQVGVDMAALLLAGKSGLLLPRANAASVNGGLLDNNLLLNDSNADGRPDGWSRFTVTGDSFALASASYPARGNACTATISQSTTAEIYTGLSAFGLGGWSSGETLRSAGMLKLANMSNCNVRVYVRVAAGDITLGIFQANTSEFVYLVSNVVMGLTDTDLQIWFEVTSLAGGAYTCNLSWAAWNVWNVSRNTY